MKDVMITVKAVQSDGEQKETMELTSEGKYGIKNGMRLISYVDAMLGDGQDAVTSVIRVGRDGVVTVGRAGAYRGRFTVEKGKRHDCVYTTPYGTMTMGFFGELVKCDLHEHGGDLYMKYAVDVNRNEINQNELFISVREV